MKIIDILIDNGLNEAMLIGDPDQAIFEWHDAEPSLFINKMERWSENFIVLNENRRSSQNICNCTCNLSSLDCTSTAINEDVKNCPLTPLVSVYDSDNIGDIIDNFKSLCKVNNIKISPDNIAILYRSKSIFNKITGVCEIQSSQYPWIDDDPYCRDFARGKYLFDNHDFKKGFNLILKAVIKRVNGSHYCSTEDINKIIEKNGLIEFRKDIYELIQIMPETNCLIGEWVEASNTNFDKRNQKLKFQIRTTASNISFNNLFGIDNKQIMETDHRLGTIHSIKGETFEAVLVILKKKGVGPFYTTMLRENYRIQDNEELRIVYVGITRPRRLLMLAVPDDTNKLFWEKKLMLDN